MCVYIYMYIEDTREEGRYTRRYTEDTVSKIQFSVSGCPDLRLSPLHLGALFLLLQLYQQSILAAVVDREQQVISIRSATGEQCAGADCALTVLICVRAELVLVRRAQVGAPRKL